MTDCPPFAFLASSSFSGGRTASDLAGLGATPSVPATGIRCVADSDSLYVHKQSASVSVLEDLA